MASLIPELKKIKAFIFDVDGVMTPGQVLITEEGHMLRSVNIKDGFAIQHAIKAGYKIGIISGGKSDGVRKRFEGLGVEHIYLGQKEKVNAFNELVKAWGVDHSEIAYMGDDFPDIPVLELAGLSCCPKDSAVDVLDKCDFISPINGGQGCVRDLIEKTMKIQGSWFNDESHRW